MCFLGIGASQKALAIMSTALAGAGDVLIQLSGLVAIYAAFFTFLGITEILGLDLRPIGNVAFAVAIVPLFYWKFFEGGWMFRSILLIWFVVFLGVAATTYGKLPAKTLGVLLLVTATYTFWVPAILIALNKTIP